MSMMIGILIIDSQLRVISQYNYANAIIVLANK